MKARERELLERQTQLLLHSATLRGQWLSDMHSLQPALDRVDLALDAWRWIRANPVWPAAALGFWLLARPRRALGLVGRAVWAWRLWRRARPLVQQGLRAWHRL